MAWVVVGTCHTYPWEERVEEACRDEAEGFSVVAGKSDADVPEIVLENQ